MLSQTNGQINKKVKELKELLFKDYEEFQIAKYQYTMLRRFMSGQTLTPDEVKQLVDSHDVDVRIMYKHIVKRIDEYQSLLNENLRLLEIEKRYNLLSEALQKVSD